MTYFLSMSAAPGARSHRPMQMQFAAPILTAEAYGFDAAPVVSRPACRAEGERRGKLGRPSGAALIAALGLGLMLSSGTLYWVLA